MVTTAEEMPVAPDDTEPPMHTTALSALAPLSFGTLTLWRAMHNFANDMLLELGLYPGQELILLQLYDADGQTHTDLQRAVRLDHSTVSRTVRRMEQAGLLTRSPGEKDKRAMVVSLTEQGRALQPRVVELWSTVETVMTEILTNDQQSDFIELASRLEQKLLTARLNARRTSS
ncbi:MarR family winged helix-turn-helix transcriptional regulator [Paractinoplanes lichenicola]|uniref:MarR family transcriptional regulator n=1 Tax=Paractinoplanes lichenicola TaxID=2802976 RepID=A0ABS1VXV6_9ACTN|nr:MarR family transcriptional regulator [Actinoplanes lichenicola]MBL7259322.1 MarR family transcriptional regulator [Actinoplanes lichenicola]